MKRISLIGMTLFLLMAPSALAETCFLTTHPLVFGSYDSFSPTPLDISGQLDVDCRPPHWAAHTHPSMYQITLSAGLNSSGSFSPRKQLSAFDGKTMAYNLYLDLTRTQVWGDGTGSTSVYEAPGDGSEHHHGLPPQADCHAHTEGSEEDHELGGCHAHVSPKFVRKYHIRVHGEKHEHPPGEYRHHEFVTTLTIYARIPANQTDLTPGAYSDSITVTINF